MQPSFRNFFQKNVTEPNVLNKSVNGSLIEYLLLMFVWYVDVHQILTQEDWNKVLYNGMASTSPVAALYFIALMTFGNYVLFNLLVAILVEGFQTEVKPVSNLVWTLSSSFFPPSLDSLSSPFCSLESSTYSNTISFFSLSPLALSCPLHLTLCPKQARRDKIQVKSNFSVQTESKNVARRNKITANLFACFLTLYSTAEERETKSMYLEFHDASLDSSLFMIFSEVLCHVKLLYQSLLLFWCLIYVKSDGPVSFVWVTQKTHIKETLGKKRHKRDTGWFSEKHTSILLL